MMSKADHSAAQIDGLHQIIDQFDTLITDQFGVLHDGSNVYPGVIDCLHILKEQGIKIAALSNSGRRSSVNVTRLQQFGFDPALFDRVLTSGELTWQLLRDRELDFLNSAQRVFVIRGKGESTLLDDLQYTVTPNTQDADFVLITGADQQRFGLSDYQKLLHNAIELKLPCICANPDVYALVDGDATYGPASIAQFYADSGAPVTWLGKPHLPIYNKLISLLTDDDPACDKRRILCVGDSPAHDVQGAQNAGLVSALVMTGLQSMDKSVRHQGAATSDYILPGLIW